MTKDDPSSTELFWQPQHPLEPLSLDEMKRAVDLLKSNSDLVTPTTRFVSIALHESPKERILNPKDDESITRQADVVLFDNATNRCHEAHISLEGQGKLVSFEHVPDVQPTMTIDEQMECEQAVLRSTEFQNLVRQHYGIEDISRVMVDIWSSGYYGTEEERTLRLARPLCFVRANPGDNGYTHPIEGLRPVVDLNRSE